MENNTAINAIDALDIDINKLSKESKTKLELISLTVYQQSLHTLPIDKVRSLLMLDVSSMPEEITISAGSTRKTADYCTNNYHGSIKIGCGMYKEAVTLLLQRDVSPSDLIDGYFSLKTGFYMLIKEKFNTNENFVRTCLREAEAKDGIQPQGRFKSD